MENVSTSQPKNAGESSHIFTLPPLPYEYSALEPYISAETLKFHHDKHHRAYVDKLNELLLGSGLENEPLEEVVRRATGSLFNQAAQHWNHDFFWKSMRAPETGRGPEGELRRALTETFGSIDEFKTEFEKRGTSVFGSGWMWLVIDPSEKLKIISTKDADTPLRLGLTPLFTCDVWEHAYYIDYRNRRADYLAQFWSVLDWEFVERNYHDYRDAHRPMDRQDPLSH